MTVLEIGHLAFSALQLTTIVWPELAETGLAALELAAWNSGRSFRPIPGGHLGARRCSTRSNRRVDLALIRLDGLAFRGPVLAAY